MGHTTSQEHLFLRCVFGRELPDGTAFVECCGPDSQFGVVLG